MADEPAAYEPLDLGPYCNVGLDILGPGADRTATGQVTLRGLPFVVGPSAGGDGACLIAPAEPVTVPLGRPARRIVVAHRQLAPTAPAGHGIGAVVAHYRFHLEGGRTVEVPIRERFEIQIVDHEWGQGPFLAVTDRHDANAPRFEGRWDDAGYRLTEHSSGSSNAWFLWCWENPEPGLVVESIELAPGSAPFVVGAVTVANGDEYPFVNQAGRPVRLIVTDPDLASRDAALDLEVDRGVATYPQPVPTVDDRPGWGALSDPEHAASPAYATVAATPSASLTVRLQDEQLGRVRWGDVERDGSAVDGRVRVELTDPGRNWVHVKVLDDETGQPVPCRVAFRSPAGVPFQPHGHHQHVAQNLGSWHYDVGGDVRLGDRTFAYIDGTCQGWLPRGDVVVEVARGFEYSPLQSTVRVEPGQRELTLRISRTADMAAAGWWSGDSHVHFLSTAGAQLEQRGEDLRVVNLLQAQWGALFTNTEDFSGHFGRRPNLIDSGEYVTYVGQENRQHVLGHLVMWGLTEPVMPWSTGGPDEAELAGALDTTMSDWADRAHAQGGTVVSAHFPNPNGEPAALVATGRTDAVEMLSQTPNALIEYYCYLNAGYRLPLVGGTDKMSADVPVGLYRTYAHLPRDEEPGYDAWVRAVRAGRTFLSGGPLLTLTVDGREPGETVELSGAGTVSVHAAVTSIFRLRSLEIVCNGRVVAAATPTQTGEGTFALTIDENVHLDGAGWIACRATGVDNHLDEWRRPVFAHTSPVYVASGGPWEMADPDSLRYIRTVVTGARDYVRHTAIRRDDHTTTHHHGQPDHLSWLQRPFDDALSALDRRLS